MNHWFPYVTPAVIETLYLDHVVEMHAFAKARSGS